MKPRTSKIKAICGDEIQRPEDKHFDHAHYLQPTGNIEEHGIKLIVNRPNISYMPNDWIGFGQGTYYTIPLTTKIIQRLKHQSHKSKQTIPGKDKGVQGTPSHLNQSRRNACLLLYVYFFLYCDLEAFSDSCISILVVSLQLDF